MKIALGSDLHLEFRTLEVTNTENADVLILAGDIVIAEDLYDHTPESIQESLDKGNKLGKRQQSAIEYRTFLKQCSDQFKHVIYISGNHEFYHGKWYAGLDYLRAECGKYPNVIFLENEMVEIDEILFVGAALWTDMNKNDWHTMYQAKQSMSDYRIILNDKLKFSKLKPEDTVVRHNASLKFIESAIKGAAKVVVVTHHAPSEMSVAECYKGHMLNGAYRSHLENVMLDNPNIALWLHGHTHHPFDYQVSETRVVCNPRGYPGEPSFINYTFKYLEI
jgi:Icc-related predicted phosphoesterase